MSGGNLLRLMPGRVNFARLVVIAHVEDREGLVDLPSCERSETVAAVRKMLQGRFGVLGRMACLRTNAKGPTMTWSAPYPIQRFRRLRRTDALRSMVAETRLSAADFIWPIFITDVPGADVEISSMPGVRRVTLDGAVRAAEEAATLGIPAMCPFPYTDPALKTETCEEAWSPDNLSNRVIRQSRRRFPMSR